MSRVERFRIKNAMIIANLISNVIGVAVVILLGRFSSSTVSEELLQLIEQSAASCHRHLGCGHSSPKEILDMPPNWFLVDQ